MSALNVTREELIGKLKARGFKSYADITRPMATSFCLKVSAQTLPLTADERRQQVLIHIYGRLTGAINQEPCVAIRITGDNIPPSDASGSVTLTGISYGEVFDERGFRYALYRVVRAWRAMVAPVEALATDPDVLDEADCVITGGMW